MPIFLVGPIGVVPSERQITLNRPSNHSQVSEDLIFPPGPIGPGFISPSEVHLPTKYPSRPCSGPGLGACAAANCRPAADTTVNATSSLNGLFMVSPSLAG